MGRHKGRLRVTFDALRAMLELPPDARVMSIECTGRDIGMEQFHVYVEHPSLPKWIEGAEVWPVVDASDLRSDE